MSDEGRIWLVKQRASDSYEGYTEAYETVSLHRTEEGAKKRAARLEKDAAVYTLTGGSFSDHEADPDVIVGAIDDWNSEVGSMIRAELSKPGANFVAVLLFVIKKCGFSYANTKVAMQVLED